MPEAVKRTRADTCRLYVAFLLVGMGCGWFVADAIFQLLTNVPETRQGGKAYGLYAEISGIVGISLAGLFFVLLMVSPRKPTMRTDQHSVTLLITLTVLSLAALAAFWDVGAPYYHALTVLFTLSNIVANLTYFLLFPVISTYYGGWLIAPVRAGTDMSTFFTTILAEFENPSGNKNLFPPEILLVVYTAMASSGFVAWQCIIRYKIGLLSEVGQTEEQQPKTKVAAPLTADVELAQQSNLEGENEEEGKKQGGESQGMAASFMQGLRALSCPRELVAPVVLAVLAECSQWGFLVTVGEIGARMTDPAGCTGAKGNTVFRTAVTLNRALLPMASITSSIAWCPRWLFYVLSGIQLAAAAAICLLIEGHFRGFWTSDLGQAVYTVCFAVAGALEGYVLTMAYRYIGDSPKLSNDQKRSASTLLSFLSVVAVNPTAIVVGQLVNSGAIACRA